MLVLNTLRITMRLKHMLHVEGISLVAIHFLEAEYTNLRPRDLEILRWSDDVIIEWPESCTDAAKAVCDESLPHSYHPLFL